MVGGAIRLMLIYAPTIIRISGAQIVFLRIGEARDRRVLNGPLRNVD